ncbi:MAG: type II toxin-antitoxin system RelE/ParE family toxin [Candidatus Aenigmarchaeota archaeon]|nr:type II toxin-antitoxin system RelE/ParE family toxin [Candidatus Aenigmarchaeota archaeon]
MMYEIVFSNKSERQLKKLEGDVQERIISALERIRIRPEEYIIKLVGDPGFKLRVGDYRVIVDIDRSVMRIHVLKIGHRKSIYKR